jgi:enoyl-CoA hydratase/carnithine racemase
MTAALVQKDDTGLAWVTLNRREQLNQVDLAMALGLRAGWVELEEDPEVRAVVVTAAGPEAFCVGFDQVLRGDGIAIGPRRSGLTKPLVVAVNGVVDAEGYELLEEADLVLASEHARLFLPAGRTVRGVVFDEWATPGCARFRRRSVTSAEALARGLVDEVVPLVELRRHARRLSDDRSRSLDCSPA